MSVIISNNVFQKHPDSVLDYAWDWSEWLEEGEKITSAVITIPSGLTLESQSDLDQKVIAWISGGTAKAKYRVTCHITTDHSPAREDSRSIFIKCGTR